MASSDRSGEDVSRTVFPSLTCVRAGASTSTLHQSFVKASVTADELENTTTQLGCSSLSALQAAWALILFAYAGNDVQEVSFLTADHRDNEPSGSTSSSETSTIETRIQSGRGLVADVLNQLSSDNTRNREPQNLRHGETRQSILVSRMGTATAKEMHELRRASYNSAVILEVSADNERNLCCRAVYTNEHLSSSSAAIMVEEFLDLLSWILVHPKSPLLDAICSVKPSLLSSVNTVPVHSPLEKKFPLIQSQFESIASTFPKRDALIFKYDLKSSSSIEWTYEELNSKANAFAEHLSEHHGPVMGTIIPICMKKRPELYVAILGIVKAGAAWCPIDASSPPSRRRDLISRTGAKVLTVAQDSDLDLNGIPSGIAVVNLALLQLPMVQENLGSLPQSSLNSKRLTSVAYMIWTSGTTGPPKGVSISHQAAITSMSALQARIPTTSRSLDWPRCVQFSQQTFDVFVQDLFFTWGAGGTLISSTQELMNDSFVDLVADTGATHAHLTPAFASSVSRRACPSLEVVTMIGEKLPQQVADDWSENNLLYNTYGPAEASVVSTVHQIFGKDDNVKSTNIGRPLPSVSCYVLRDGRLVMTGGVGELALGGHQLATEYMKDPSKTAEKFIWNAQVRERLYLTGDIVRLLSDGTLEFLGRDDDLVKLGGIRVELSEIDNALSNCHPLAEDTVTCYFSRADRPRKTVVTFVACHSIFSEAQPNAFVSLGPQAATIASSALERARTSLPEYMNPTTFLIIQKIPKTSSAKVDRKWLQLAFDSLDLEAWENEMHKNLPGEYTKWTLKEVSILEHLSKISGVLFLAMSRMSSLRALGIDSIQAGRLAKLLCDSHHPISTIGVLRSSTIQDLLRAIDEFQVPSTREFDVFRFNELWHPIIKSAVHCPALTFVLPASPLQEGLLSESLTQGKAYWNHFLYQLDDRVDLQRLHKAWQHLSNSNEALRTTFMATSQIDIADRPKITSSSFVQLVHATHEIDWAIETALTELKSIATKVSRKHHLSNLALPPWTVTIVESREKRIMIFTIHHALHDARSLEFVLEDLWSEYEGLPSDSRPQLRDTVAATWQLQSEYSNIDREFWSPLLTEFRNPESMAWPDLTIMGSQGTEVARLSRRKRLRLPLLPFSLLSIIRAAFGLLLLDYLETDKIIFGEVVSQRELFPQVEQAIAPLISLLPVLFRRQACTRALLQDQDDLASRSRSHRSLPNTLMRKILGKPYEQPLYPAIFVYHPTGSTSHVNELWRVADEEIDLSVEHPLALNVSNDDGWELEFSADGACFTPEHLELLADQTSALIDEMIKYPEKATAGLLDDNEKEVISLTRSPLPSLESSQSDVLPVYWVDHHALHHPQWSAVEVAEDGSSIQKWDYSTLAARANHIAKYIIGRGHRRQIIALCTRRSLESYAAILGILKSGNIYLPVDDRLPAERKAVLLKDSRCILLFTDHQTTGLLGNLPADCALENLDHRLEVLDQGKPLPELDSTETAYIIYTSGSTGTPKGVLISHGSLTGFIEGLTNAMEQYSSAGMSKTGVGKWLGLASRAFDVHLAEMFLAWRLGLATVTAPREVLLDDLQHSLNWLGVTHACFVPSLLDQAGLEPDDVPNLVFMTVGGEKLSKRVLDTWTKKKDLTIMNAYGPTELAIGCSVAVVTSNSNVSDIGHPIGDSVAHVLIPGTFHYCKRGQPGELCYTGSLVGNGYLDRPDAKGFVENLKGHRMYRTGDTVRMMVNGSLQYLGRSDDQTKIRGQRIELAEISETIRLSSVAEVDVATLVLKHPELSSNSLLVAFISPVAERSKRYGAKVKLVEASADSTLQTICRQKLPTFMVPDYILHVDVIPLAPVSGKADAKSLKTFFSSIPLSLLLGDTGTKRRDLLPNEIEIRNIVCSIINVPADSIDQDSNLFSFGFDSLSIVGLVMKLRKIGIHKDLSSLLRNPTIRSIASTMSITDADQTDLAKEKLSDWIVFMEPFEYDRDRIECIRPCLPTQESVVAATVNDDSKELYINRVQAELDADLDIDRFKDAWTMVMRSNPILRTFFWHTNSSIIMMVIKASYCELQWQDEVNHKRKSESDSISREIAEKIFVQPPIRFVIYRKAGQSSVMKIYIHHALYDGESLRMVFEDVYAVYCGKSQLCRLSFDLILGQYLLQDQTASRMFWRKYFSGFHPSRAARDNNGPSQYVRRLFKSKTSELRAIATNLHISLATLLQCAFAVTIARFTEEEDLCYGVVLSGRTIALEGVDTIAAPCITTIPQRLQMQSQPQSFSEIALMIHDQSAECLKYQQTPLRSIREWLGNGQLLFEYLFSFSESRPPIAYPKLWEVREGSMALDYPLALEVVDDSVADEMLANYSYKEAFGRSTRVEELIDEMEALLTRLADGACVMVSRSESSRPSQEIAEWSEKEWSLEEIIMREATAILTGLHVDQITKNALFFQFGIDSVSAIPFAQRLRLKGLDVRSSKVMQYPSIGALAGYLNRMSITDTSSSMGSNESQKSTSVDEAEYICTPLQSGMIAATLASGGSLYVHCHGIRLKKTLDMSRLREAWLQVCKANDILRTSFTFDSNPSSEWVAKVNAELSENWKEWPSEIPIDKVKECMILRSEADFEKPPVQVHILPKSEGCVLILLLHHALYDGLSVPLILAELASEYKGTDNVKRPRPQFMPAAQYILERQSLSNRFWIETLIDFRSSSTFPFQSAEMQPARIKRKTLRQSKADVLDKCKALGVTPQTLGLVAFAKTISSLSKQKDVVFGHVVAGRSLPIDGCENIIGPLFNTLPFRIQLGDPETNSELLTRVQGFTSRAQPFQNASLQYVQNAWRRESDSSARLFESLFLFEKDVGHDSVSHNLWEPYSIDQDTAGSEYALAFEMTQRADHISIYAACRGPEAMNRDLAGMLELFDFCITNLLDHPAQSAVTYPPTLKDLPHRQPGSERTDFHESTVKRAIPQLDQIRVILSELSGAAIHNIFDTTTIYSLGLDSIAAIRIASKCRACGLEISVADVLQGVSVQGIFDRIMSRVGRKTAIGTPHQKVDMSSLSIDRQKVQELLPCLSGQMYHLRSWLASGRTFGESTWAYRSKKLDAARLKNAWNRVRVMHTILRTQYYACPSGKVFQVILKLPDEMEHSVKVVHTKTDSHAVRNGVRRLRSRCMDPRSPPNSLSLISGSEDSVILLSLHHVSYDAWTIPILIQDLSNVYQDRHAEQLSEYSDFVRYTAGHLDSHNEGRYWKEALDRYEPTVIGGSGSAHSRSPKPAFSSIQVSLSNDLDLELFCQSKQVSLSSLLLLAYARVLARTAGVTNPTFGYHQAGRSASFPDIDRVSGPCVNVTPMRIVSALEIPVPEALRQLQIDLASRTSFEQSYLPTILEWIGAEGKVVFNTYINILWHMQRSNGATDSIFQPIDIGNPTDYSNGERFEGSTGFESLTWPLAEQALYVDVDRGADDGSVALAARAQGNLMSATELTDFLDELVNELERIIGEL